MHEGKLGGCGPFSQQAKEKEACTHKVLTHAKDAKVPVLCAILFSRDGCRLMDGWMPSKRRWLLKKDVKFSSFFSFAKRQQYIYSKARKGRNAHRQAFHVFVLVACDVWRLRVLR